MMQAPRWSLGRAFKKTIAKYKFVPVVETTIESKHQKVSTEEKRHHIGPVRVSLSNRMPWLEQNLAKHPETITEILDSFSKARKLHQMPLAFGLEEHPLLVNKKHTTSQLVTSFGCIVYHCVLATAFRSLKPAAKNA